MWKLFNNDHQHHHKQNGGGFLDFLSKKVSPQNIQKGFTAVKGFIPQKAQQSNVFVQAQNHAQNLAASIATRRPVQPQLQRAPQVIYRQAPPKIVYKDRVVYRDRPLPPQTLPLLPIATAAPAPTPVIVAPTTPTPTPAISTPVIVAPPAVVQPAATTVIPTQTGGAVAKRAQTLKHCLSLLEKC